MHLVKSMACDQPYNICLENLWGNNGSASVFISETWNANFKLLSRLSQYASSVASSALDNDLALNKCMYQPDLCTAFRSYFRAWYWNLNVTETTTKELALAFLIWKLKLSPILRSISFTHMRVPWADHEESFPTWDQREHFLREQPLQVQWLLHP